MLALEGTGIIGPGPAREVRVRPRGPGAVLAKFGIVEDEASGPVDYGA